jgi:hypothetical protein
MISLSLPHLSPLALAQGASYAPSVTSSPHIYPQQHMLAAGRAGATPRPYPRQEAVTDMMTSRTRGAVEKDNADYDDGN